MDEKLILKIHISFALLGLFGGVFGFIVFVFGFYNYHAGNFLKKSHTLPVSSAESGIDSHSNWISSKQDDI